MTRWITTVAAAGLALAPIGAAMADAPARSGVDAPELAALGAYPIGVADATFVQPGQLYPLPDGSEPVVADRRLAVKIWYPAAAAGGGTTYRTALPGEDTKPVAFDIPGLATPGVRVAAGRFPLIILAHGGSNTPEVMSWLGENLASKGYVVVAPAFGDPPISLRTLASMAGPLARRPLDIVFVAAEAQRRARAGDGPLAAADPDRTALVGYSMGGYGVLAAAGGRLAPQLEPATRRVLAPFVAGAPRAGELKVAGLKAVVSIAPPRILGNLPLWADGGMTSVTAPILFIVGSQDRVVGYDPGVRTLFSEASRTRRYLLTFREAAHSIALIGAPASMTHTFWDKDWFEDGVWRKDRLIAIQTHFITAFLARYVKDDAAKAAYIDGLTTDSDTGVWATAPAGRYAGYSPGAPASTIWKGFQPSKRAGMSFEVQTPANGREGE
ncbi:MULTISPECIES: dienelactone hydrolase [unclassified Sphingomonas]|jgi:predicted dienelactone hydrolase|uniref:alpha/beta hydrolase family protein n=1 Tax=unclassified Sphingomonas TaxID=196159 RepID=UPI000E103986|nr:MULTISPECIES: dienelactone hydrolase [unclassified Sphingomonas]AXJ94409.1 dienelactone hydrolase [Sphingomonas sp. FARSPH]